MADKKKKPTLKGRRTIARKAGPKKTDGTRGGVKLTAKRPVNAKKAVSSSGKQKTATAKRKSTRPTQKKSAVRNRGLLGGISAVGGAIAANTVGRFSSKTGRTKGRKKNRSKRKAALFKGFWKETALSLVSTSFIVASAGLYYVFNVLAPKPPESADLWAVNRLPSIVILDKDGQELAARGARYGERAPVGELPPYLIKAFISTEDRRFFDHRGVDLRGILRAFFTNLRSGEIEEGGSTITQQLARNLFLTPEQNYVRKAKEALLALWIEGRYTKEEILSLYLNRIYMGAGAYGIESAARTYFNKSARDVSLSEAVMLAGLPKAPSALAPTQNPFGAQDRAWQVLDNLRETGQITEFDAREARLSPPVIQSSDANGDLGYFFDYVAEKARRRAGPDAVDLVVYTTLDRKMQRDAEAAVKAVLDVDTSIAGATQAGLIAYDNINGAMRAMVGGQKYIESQFNRSTQAKRQPGSAFKPFVYAAGFENGLRPSSRFVDQPINIAGWQPSNYSDTFRGPVRLTEAMARSINTVAVQVSETTGRDKVINTAHRLGIKSDIPTKEAGIALGGFNATLEELTAAYLPFARSGLSAEPYAIERIENGRGQVLYSHEGPRAEQVLPKRVADDMTHMLYQVMATGTGRRASLGRRHAAGKTGTTNDWRDAWFIGYTAQLTTGVWVGNDDYQPMEKVTGGTLPAEIWKDFMLAAHQGVPQRRLPGAYAAPTYSDETVLLQFYEGVARSLDRVRRDGNERRLGRR